MLMSNTVAVAAAAEDVRTRVMVIRKPAVFYQHCAQYNSLVGCGRATVVDTQTEEVEEEVG